MMKPGRQGSVFMKLGFPHLVGAKGMFGGFNQT